MKTTVKRLNPGESVTGTYHSSGDKYISLEVTKDKITELVKVIVPNEIADEGTWNTNYKISRDKDTGDYSIEEID